MGTEIVEKKKLYGGICLRGGNVLPLGEMQITLVASRNNQFWLLTTSLADRNHRSTTTGGKLRRPGSDGATGTYRPADVSSWTR